MISRRSILARILAAPVVASAAKDVAAAVEPIGGEMPTPVSGMTIKKDPIVEMAEKQLRRIESRRDAHASVMSGHVPPHIATKKSWSPAFKAHVYWQERELMHEHYRLSEGDLLALARKMGVI